MGVATLNLGCFGAQLSSAIAFFDGPFGDNSNKAMSDLPAGLFALPHLHTKERYGDIR